MLQNVRDLAAFYDAPLGRLAHRAILQEILGVWPNLRNYRLLGYGFAIPYLPAFTGTERSIAALPAPMGVIGWPDGNNAALLCEEDALPFPDVFFDRILIVHGLEASDSLRPLLRQLWRVVAPEGRILRPSTNGTRLWARGPQTPMGHSRAFPRPGRACPLIDAPF